MRVDDSAAPEYFHPSFVPHIGARVFRPAAAYAEVALLFVVAKAVNALAVVRLEQGCRALLVQPWLSEAECAQSAGKERAKAGQRNFWHAAMERECFDAHKRTQSRILYACACLVAETEAQVLDAGEGGQPRIRHIVADSELKDAHTAQRAQAGIVGAPRGAIADEDLQAGQACSEELAVLSGQGVNCSDGNAIMNSANVYVYNGCEVNLVGT